MHKSVFVRLLTSKFSISRVELLERAMVAGCRCVECKGRRERKVGLPAPQRSQDVIWFTQRRRGAEGKRQAPQAVYFQQRLSYEPTVEDRERLRRKHLLSAPLRLCVNKNLEEGRRLHSD